MNNKIQRNIAQAALFLRHYGYYGSEQKAIAALKRRKDTQGISKDMLNEALMHALEILSSLDELARKILSANKVSRHPQLTQEQYSQGEEELRSTLIRDYPEDGIAIDYFIGMNWHMPYVR